jgi:Predicted enzyme with a TIM-barrel fold
MAVAPHPDSGIGPGRAFATLAEVAAALRADHPEATVLSAGMSGDLEAAIEAGATQVRIGGAVLGQRPRVQ